LEAEVEVTRPRFVKDPGAPVGDLAKKMADYKAYSVIHDRPDG